MSPLLTIKTHLFSSPKLQSQMLRLSYFVATVLILSLNLQGLIAQAPVAICQNISIATDTSCQGTAIAADFDGGSTDPNGRPLTFKVNHPGPYALGMTNVTLTVTNNNADSSTCNATITVVDSSPPIPSSRWDQITKITASDAQADDDFGLNVSISGDYAIVATSERDTGTVYIFKKNAAGMWSEIQKIQDSDSPNKWDDFGKGISISEDYAIVGARGKDNGTGTAYIFAKNSAGTWIEVQKIEASDREDFDLFGESVAISGNYAIIGAPGESTGAAHAGAAYIFERNSAGIWLEVNKVQASSIQAGVGFGNTVSISGDYAILGVAREGTSAFPKAGSAYIFERNSLGIWTQAQKIQASDKQARDAFGYSVFVSGDYIMVSSHWKDHGAGVVYIFERNSRGTWLEVQKIQNPNRQNSARFGKGLSISGNYAVLGSARQHTNRIQPGVAYIFQRSSTGVWVEIQKIYPSDKIPFTHFGSAVAISGKHIIAGAPSYHSSGVNRIGAVYMYEKQLPSLVLPDVITECSINLTAPTATDNCAGIIIATTSDSTFHTIQGRDTVTWIFDDGNGNSISQTQVVIIGDTVNPTAICRDIIVHLNASGSASISISDIDNRSNDYCGIASFSLSQDTFYRADIGVNTVTLTVTDNSGNISTCTAQVTVNIGVGIEDPIVNSLNLYPSPTADFINLKSTITRQSDLQLYISDATGRVVWRGFLPKGAAKQMRIDVSKLATGVYILHAGGGGFSPIKWMKI